ncbi:MAG: hypothetical protein WCG25_06000 [bacterium]
MSGLPESSSPVRSNNICLHSSSSLILAFLNASVKYPDSYNDLDIAFTSG